MIQRALAIAALAVGYTNAESLRNVVQASLEAASGLNVEVGGVNNCQNKCFNLLGYLSYESAVIEMQNGGNNEYRACVLGCTQCYNVQQTASQGPTVSNPTPDPVAGASGWPAPSTSPANCYQYCKNFDYATDAGDAPIEKGIIEPDKACIIGCTIQLCQGFCTGSAPFTANQPLDGSGGCQIQTGYGIQTYTIAGNAPFSSCCNPLQNICTYKGKQGTSNPNWNSILHQAQQTCNGVQIGGITLTSTSDCATLCYAYSQAVNEPNPQCGAPISAIDASCLATSAPAGSTSTKKKH